MISSEIFAALLNSRLGLQKEKITFLLLKSDNKFVFQKMKITYYTLVHITV